MNRNSVDVELAVKKGECKLWVDYQYDIDCALHVLNISAAFDDARYVLTHEGWMLCKERERCRRTVQAPKDTGRELIRMSETAWINAENFRYRTENESLKKKLSEMVPA